MTRHPAPSPARIRRAPALVAVFGASGFIMLFALAQLLQPSIDPSWQPPSQLALGPFGWVMTTAFLLFGAACAGLGVAIWSQAVSWPGRIGVIAVFAAAIGCLFGGAFPTDPTTVTPDAMTLTGTLHAFGPVLLDGIPIAAVLLAISFTRRSPDWRRVRGLLVLGAVLTVGAAALLTVSMALLMPASGQLGPDVPIGWQGRLLLLVDALWVVGVAVCALRLRRSAERAASAASSGSTAVSPSATSTSTSERVS
jgi:hypothetical protein